MQAQVRGRLRPGQPKVVGARGPRQPSAAVILGRVVLPLMLFFGMALWVGRHTAGFVRSLRASTRSSQIEWYESSAAAAPVYQLADLTELSAFTPEVRRWSGAIERWSREHDLPVLLVATVMQIESCGDARALSPSGARGLFQVMPFHFVDGENTFDPEVNAQRGLAYLRQAYELASGRIDLTLAGYNGGHSQISRSLSLWPDETRRYVSWGTGIWEDVREGGNSSLTLNAWLEAGGSRLCQAAHASLTD